MSASCCWPLFCRFRTGVHVACVTSGVDGARCFVNLTAQVTLDGVFSVSGPWQPVLHWIQRALCPCAANVHFVAQGCGPRCLVWGDWLELYRCKMQYTLTCTGMQHPFTCAGLCRDALFRDATPGASSVKQLPLAPPVAECSSSL